MSVSRVSLFNPKKSAHYFQIFSIFLILIFVSYLFTFTLKFFPAQCAKYFYGSILDRTFRRVRLFMASKINKRVTAK